MTVSHYSGGLAELRRLLKTLKSPTFRLTRDRKDVTAEEIATLEAEIARREASVSVVRPLSAGSSSRR